MFINTNESITKKTPYLYLNKAHAALEFYHAAFNAKTLITIKDKENRIAHAEIEIGKERIMLSDEFSSHENEKRDSITLFFDDAEIVFTRAISAGARELIKAIGDQGPKIVDPFGHQWCISAQK